MKRTIMAGVGALALAMATAPAALATQDGTPGYETTTTTVEAADCGTATVTFVNPTEWTFWGDYRQIGIDEGVDGEQVGSEVEITEGPLAGEKFGLVYNQVKLEPGATEPVTIDIPEDTGNGSVQVEAWINRGPEQRSFSRAAPVTVTTDCESNDTNTGDGQDEGDKDNRPAGDGKDGDKDDKQPADDGGVEQVGDEANEDGTAPTPTPQEGHVAVTG